MDDFDSVDFDRPVSLADDVDFRVMHRGTHKDFWFPQVPYRGEWRTILHQDLSLLHENNTFNTNFACNTEKEARQVIEDYKELVLLGEHPVREQIIPDNPGPQPKEEDKDMSYMEPEPSNRWFRWGAALVLAIMVYIAAMVTPWEAKSSPMFPDQDITVESQFSSPFGQVYPSSEFDALVVTGTIDHNTLNMIQFYNNTMGVEKITFHSPGGLAMIGFNIGYYMKEHGITAEVREGNMCVSACAFAFLMAEKKIMKGTLAFHHPYNTNNEVSKIALEKQSLEVGAIFMNYVMETGYGQWFPYFIITNTGPDVFYVISDWKEFEDRFWTPKDTPYGEYFAQGHKGVEEWLSTKIMSSEKMVKVFLTKRSMMEKSKGGPR